MQVGLIMKGDTMKRRNLDLEKKYQEEWINLLNYVEKRYAEIKDSGDRNRRQAMEKIINELCEED